MGCCKQLLPVGGVPAVALCVDKLRNGGVEPIIVVIGGPYEAEVAAILQPLAVIIVRNPEPAGDMASSLRCALPHLPAEVPGVAVLPADTPCVTTTTIRQLVAAFAAHQTGILVPSTQNRRGHPVLLAKELFLGLREAGTLRDLLHRQSKKIVHLVVADQGILFDMDTQEEYAALMAKFPTS
jgi:molybdenum cofactor cytidylyltransferase